MTRIKRSLYKRPRPPARDAGVFAGQVLTTDTCRYAPIGCPDATSGEVTKALYSIGQETGVTVGRGCGYETLKDEYYVIGKSLVTGKAQDFRIKGETVADLIMLARVLNGGRMAAPSERPPGMTLPPARNAPPHP